MALAAADAMSCPEVRIAHTTVATIAPTHAIVDASPSSATSAAPITNAGAITRNAVSITGRGASVASSPSAHAAHNSTAPAIRGPLDHVARDADAPGPAVTGRVIHATRSSHRKRGRGSGTPFDSGVVSVDFR